MVSSGSHPTEKLRIDSDGDVIIGSGGSWQYKKPLNVQGSSGSIISLYNADTTSYAANTNTSIEFKLLTGNTGSQFGACEIRAFKENGTNGNNARALSFYTGANGGGNAERLRIPSDGGILVGTSSKTGLGSHTGAGTVSTFNQSGITLTQYAVVAGFYYDRLNFTNSQYFIVNSSNQGVYLGNGSTSWTAYSDERLKTNITELDGTKAYNHVKTARAASFKWNATGYPTDMKIGFIAQDWETNYPEVVNTTTETIDSVENPKGIQYTETVPVLMAALKQSISKIEALEARVATLEGS